MIFNAEHIVRIRVLMLTTALRPYEGIADLFMIDPDGFVIRKWNSKARMTLFLISLALEKIHSPLLFRS